MRRSAGLRGPTGATVPPHPHQPAGVFRAQRAASVHRGREASPQLARRRPSRRSGRDRRGRPVHQLHRPAARIGVAGGVVRCRRGRARHRRRPARQPDLSAEQRVDRHCPAFRSVLVIPRRGGGPARPVQGRQRRRTTAGGCAGRVLGGNGPPDRFLFPRTPQPADRPPRRRKMTPPGQPPERRTTPMQPRPQPPFQPFAQTVRALPRWRPVRRRRAPVGRLRRGAGRRARDGGHRPVSCAARPG